MLHIPLATRLIVETVGNNLKNQGDDVRRVKTVLSELKYFQEDHENEYLTRNLHNAVLQYQTDRNLQIDGRLYPGGETEKALLRDISEGSRGVLSTSVPARKSDTYGPPKPLADLGSNLETERRLAVLGKGRTDFYVAPNSKVKGHKPWYAWDDRSEVHKYEKIIEDQAKFAGVDPDLVKAIAYVETTQGWYDWTLELFDGNKTIRPMNVSSSSWRDLGYSREDIKKPENNIKAGITIIKGIKENYPDASVEQLATLYNSLGMTKVSDYGARVKEVYTKKPWVKKK